MLLNYCCALLSLHCSTLLSFTLLSACSKLFSAVLRCILLPVLLLHRPANAKQEEPVSYTTRHEENGIDDTNDEECSSDNENRNNNVILRTSAPRENLEHTSNNLSKLADKLNASKQASGIPSKIASKSAFRRKGSSNIAKLNTGRDKERSGSTQIHGQTPYSKSPKPESKPPLGARRSGTEAPVNKQTRLSRISAIPGGIKKTFLRKDDDNEVDHVNETVSLPSKKQKGLLV